MGIYKWNLNNKTYYGHGGFYGSMLAYEPIDKVTFSVNIGQAIPPYDTSIVVSQLLQIITN
jgi:D-alanyl-D-alanine carboxypeptidase